MMGRIVNPAALLVPVHTSTRIAAGRRRFRNEPTAITNHSEYTRAPIFQSPVSRWRVENRTPMRGLYDDY